MKLGHISDLHVLELDRPRPWQFLNKRVVGGTNLLLNRSKSHSTDVVKAALGQIDALGVDHIAISGDLTNLALDSEFAAAAEIVATINDASRRVSVVPGNHDYYTRGAARARRFETYFAPYLRSDLPDYQLASGYPFCKLLGEDVALVGLNSGIATPLLFATGQVDVEELRRAQALLDDPLVRERFKVVMIHHPVMPVNYKRVEFSRRLINADDVLRVVRRGDVDLVIHGHTHHFATLQLPKLRSHGSTFVCEAGCTSVAHHRDPHMAGKFNIYHIADRRLQKIETHLFESHEAGFRPWREQVFEQTVNA
ncbi:MAG: metallophosphoesterase [Bradymonadaceae bacterium]|nr:metallophosphoesterase [Lujinxingiaceae bacterium]